MLNIFFLFLGLFGSSVAEKLYPCLLNDLPCISDVLAAYSACDQNVTGSVPDPIVHENVAFNGYYFNSTFFDYRVAYRNIYKSYVSAFYINTETSTLVMSVTCPDLAYETHRNVILHRPQQESITNDYNLTAQYPPVIFTATFPLSKDIDICSAYVFPYVTGLPTYNVDYDTKIAEEIRNLVVNHNDVYARESTGAKGPKAFRIWVNSMLCNFNDNCSC